MSAPAGGRGWRILRDGKPHGDAEATFRFAKQAVRRLRAQDPGARWTVRDPAGREVIAHEPEPKA